MPFLFILNFFGISNTLFLFYIYNLFYNISSTSLLVTLYLFYFINFGFLSIVKSLLLIFFSVLFYYFDHINLKSLKSIYFEGKELIKMYIKQQSNNNNSKNLRFIYICIIKIENLITKSINFYSITENKIMNSIINSKKIADIYQLSKYFYNWSTIFLKNNFDWFYEEFNINSNIINNKKINHLIEYLNDINNTFFNVSKSFPNNPTKSDNNEMMILEKEIEKMFKNENIDFNILNNKMLNCSFGELNKILNDFQLDMCVNDLNSKNNFIDQDIDNIIDTVQKSKKKKKRNKKK